MLCIVANEVLLEVFLFKVRSESSCLFNPLTVQGSVHPIIFIFTPALALGCVNANMFVVPMIDQLHTDSSFLRCCILNPVEH